MEVTCPKCDSRFSLPDTVAKPGARLRCSVCKEVFRLEPPQESTGTASAKLKPHNFDIDTPDELSLATTKPRGRGRKIVFILVLLCFIGGGGGAGGWWYYTHKIAPQATAQPVVSLEKKVELLTMRNVRQYYVNNEKIGPIFVIEGKVVNEFPLAKELIQIEAALYTADKQTLVSKTQLAGATLSLFQLQVLGEKELEAFLHNKIEVLTNNTNIPTGSEVPFMILFYNPPSTVAEFGVKIVDVKDVPPAK